MEERTKSFTSLEDSGFFEAIEHGDLATIKAIFNRSPRMDLNLEPPSEDRSAPLHLAALHVKDDIVRFLIDVGADVNFYHWRTEARWECTPLLCAATWFHLSTVEILLDHGANVNFYTQTADSVISSVFRVMRWDSGCIIGKPEQVDMIRLLLERGHYVDHYNPPHTYKSRWGASLVCTLLSCYLFLLLFLLMLGKVAG